jgi:hypothetical protein
MQQAMACRYKQAKDKRSFGNAAACSSSIETNRKIILLHATYPMMTVDVGTRAVVCSDMLVICSSSPSILWTLIVLSCFIV